jgi:hypothetical protein
MNLRFTVEFDELRRASGFAHHGLGAKSDLAAEMLVNLIFPKLSQLSVSEPLDWCI